MDKEFIFTEEENKLKTEKYIEFYDSSMEKEYFEHVNKIKIDLSECEDKIALCDGSDYVYCNGNDSDDENFQAKQIIKTQVLEIKSELCNNLINLKAMIYETDEFKEKIKKIAEDLSNQFIINTRLETLQNCNVMEYTPLGNVLMMYDKNTESFKFYSDNTIPYRYLEVVARKFVKQFNCRPIFTDMEDELIIAENKWDKERKEIKDKEESINRQKEEAIKNKKPIEEKKNVFAKFKSYNKESGTGHVSTSAPPKNSMPSKIKIISQENEKVLLKQKANRYTYEGKIANFSFLKKINRKEVDKKFATSFADFKKNILKK
jgi:hypothetical protein